MKKLKKLYQKLENTFKNNNLFNLNFIKIFLTLLKISKKDLLKIKKLKIENNM